MQSKSMLHPISTDPPVPVVPPAPPVPVVVEPVVVEPAAPPPPVSVVVPDPLATTTVLLHPTPLTNAATTTPDRNEGKSIFESERTTGNASTAISALCAKVMPGLPA